MKKSGGKISRRIAAILAFSKCRNLAMYHPTFELCCWPKRKMSLMIIVEGVIPYRGLIICLRLFGLVRRDSIECLE